MQTAMKQTQKPEADLSSKWGFVAPMLALSNSATKLNDNEFLNLAFSNSATKLDDSDCLRLVKYNVLFEEWTPYLPSLHLCSGDIYHQPRDAIQLDRDNNRLFYVCVNHDGGGVTPLSEYLTTSIVDLRSGSLILREFSYDSHPHKCQHAMVSVNGTMHKVCHTHTIWNDTSRKWEPIKVSPAFLNDAHPKLQCISLFHVSSNGFLLMFAGNAGIWKYRIESGLWTEIKDQQNKPLRLDFCASRAVMSANQRLAIIVPDNNVAKQWKHFRVLNITEGDQYKLWESSVAEPDNVQLITSSGGPGEEQKTQSLVFGWIRKHVKAQFVPCALQMLIKKWYSMEMIHYFVIDEENEDCHKMIPLEHILGAKL